jgi:hypothetical protein
MANARFAPPGKPRALVVRATTLAYILKCIWASSSVQNAHQRYEATVGPMKRWGVSSHFRPPSPSMCGERTKKT